MSSIEYINSVVLTSAQSSVTFSAIPPNYNDLKVIITPKVSANTTFGLRFNSVSTGSLYSDTFLYSNGSTAASTKLSNQNEARISYQCTARSTNDGGIIEVDLLNYKNVNIYKTIISNAGIAAEGVDNIVALFRSTDAISTIDIIPISGGTILSSGMSATLWGVK